MASQDENLNPLQFLNKENDVKIPPKVTFDPSLPQSPKKYLHKNHRRHMTQIIDGNVPLSERSTKERIRSELLSNFLQPAQNFFYVYIYTYFFGKPKLPTYEDLLKLEDARKHVIRKSYHTGLLLLWAWSPTILCYVFQDLQFWSCLVLYALIRFYVQYEDTVQLQVPSSGIAAIGSLMSILLVYFLNSGFSRYYTVHGLCMSCQGRIFEISIMARNYISEERAKRMWKYMNAAHILGYMSFSRIHTEINFFNPLNEKHNFLTPFEMKTLKTAYDLKAGGYAYRECLEWILEEIEGDVRKGLLTQYRENKLTVEILKLRSNLATLSDSKSMPVPFMYVHYIHIVTLIYLPLFALLIASSFGPSGETEVVGFMVVLLNVTFVLGIRDMCTKLQDPFGVQYVHFNVIHFVNVGILGSYNILFNKLPHSSTDDNGEEEEEDSNDKDTDNNSDGEEMKDNTTANGSDDDNHHLHHIKKQ